MADITQLNTTMKMVRIELNSLKIFITFFLLVFQLFGFSNPAVETHARLLNVNKHWEHLSGYIQYTYRPQNEQELVQLHLMNVVAYLEQQPITHLDHDQKKNRRFNISVLKKYTKAGVFPSNSVSRKRVPVFIDEFNVHCAVGYLLQANGFGGVAKQIAASQLIAYVEEIKHPQLAAWQKNSGLTLFELALIQPTYGPPIPVCAAQSPVEWQAVPSNGKLTQLFDGPDNEKLYGIAKVDELGLRHEILAFSTDTQKWGRVGTQIRGEVLNLAFYNNHIYLSVFMPDADYPHQLVMLNGDDWVKVAHFNGNLKGMEVFQNKLYIIGNFSLVNDSIKTNFLVVEADKLLPFQATGFRNSSFDCLESSETALFLTYQGTIYKYKNDSINQVNGIQYFQYLKSYTLTAVRDTLIVSSPNFPGHTYFFNKQIESNYIHSNLHGQNIPYHSVRFSKSENINGHLVVAGDFRISTLIPQINDERHLVDCPEPQSNHWYGEGLLYEYGKMHYPILDKGNVRDFAFLNQRLYILKANGTIQFAEITAIHDRIATLRKRIEG